MTISSTKKFKGICARVHPRNVNHTDASGPLDRQVCTYLASLSNEDQTHASRETRSLPFQQMHASRMTRSLPFRRAAFRRKSQVNIWSIRWILVILPRQAHQSNCDLLSKLLSSRRIPGIQAHKDLYAPVLLSHRCRRHLRFRDFKQSRICWLQSGSHTNADNTTPCQRARFTSSLLESTSGISASPARTTTHSIASSNCIETLHVNKLRMASHVHRHHSRGQTVC